MNIEYYTKNVYGEQKIYLAQPLQAGQWRAISGRITITKNDMDIMTQFTGATFTRVFEPASVGV